VQHPQKILGVSFVPDDQPAEVLKPRKQFVQSSSVADTVSSAVDLWVGLKVSLRVAGAIFLSWFEHSHEVTVNAGDVGNILRPVVVRTSKQNGSQPLKPRL
jgi:hypothetical protein